MIKDLDQLPLEGRRVFLRVDLDVPLTKKRDVADDARIRGCVPTLRRLLDGGAKVIVASHLGRPGGKPDPRWSMEPAAVRLCELLGQTLILADDCLGDGVQKQALELEPGQVLVLENLRFHPGEEAADEPFARGLAALAEVYVNDGFETLSLPHASVAALPRHLKARGAGLQVRRELDFLGRLGAKAARPFVAIVGGARLGDKQRLVEALLARVDVLCVGGAAALPFLAARGVPTGATRVEPERLSAAKSLLETAAQRKVEVLLPVDHLAGAGPGAPRATPVPGEAVPPGLVALDIGPQTADLFARRIASARTVFWNGPVGLCEAEPFASGTLALARALAASSEVVGVTAGADTAAAMARAGLPERLSHVSVGGAAALEYVEGRVLPGLAALEE